MKKIIFILAALAALPSLAWAQAFTSTALQNSDGNYARIVPLAPVIVCAVSDTAVPCTHTVATYTDQTLGTPCTLNNNAVGAPTSGTNCNNPGVANLLGQFAVFLPAGTYQLCFYAQVWSCLPISTAGGTVNWSQVQSGSNANALTMATGGSLSPANLGQVLGTQIVLPASMQIPSASVNANGGSILSSHNIAYQVVYNTAAGVTLPSPLSSASNGGSCGTGCNFVLTGPTLPTGFTSYSVYACDTTAGPCTTPQLIASCTNLASGVNCTLTTSPTSNTSSVPTLNSAWLQPTNSQVIGGGLNALPGLIPNLWGIKADNNTYPLGGMDNSPCSPITSPCGVLTFEDKVFINDTGVNINNACGTSACIGPIKNNPFSVAHLIGSGTAGTSGNDDRAIAFRTTLPSTATGSNNPRVMGLYGETYINGSPTALTGGGPDSGEIGIRSTTVDQRSGGTLSGSPIVAIDGFTTYSGSATSSLYGSCGNQCLVGVRGTASVGSNSANGGGTSPVGGLFQANGSSGGSSWFPIDVILQAPSVFGTSGNIGLFADGSWQAGTNNYFFRADKVGLASMIEGTLYLPSVQSNASTLAVAGSLGITGAVTASQLANLSTASATCATSGSTNFTFQLVAYDSNMQPTAATTQNANSCASNISATNTITFNNINAVGASFYAIWFSNAGGGTCNSGSCTLGNVSGTLTPVAAASVRSPNAPTFVYTGTAGDGTTAPSTNTTGGGTFAGPVSAPSIATGNASFTNCNGVTSGCQAFGEGSAPTGSANVDTLHADATDHRFDEIANSGTKQHLTESLSATGTLTYTTISAQTCQEQTMAVTGAATTQAASASPQATLGNTNLSWSAWVSSSGTVSVRVCNPSAGSITPSAVTWTVGVYTP